MGRKKKEVVNPEFEKMAVQTQHHGVDVDVETIAGMDDGQRGALDKYLQSMDRGEDVEVPDIFSEAIAGTEPEVEQPEETVIVTTDEQVMVVDSVLPVPGAEFPTPSETDRLIAELREQVAGLQRQFNHVPMLTPRQQEALSVAEEIGELTMFVIEAESKFNKLDKEAKAAKKAFEAARDDMQAANERLHEITSGGDYQRRLFPTYPSTDFTTHAESLGQPVSAVAGEDVAVEQVEVDFGGSIMLDELSRNGLQKFDDSREWDGLTAKKIEALKAEVGETVADLESWLQAGYRLDSIKGFGPEWVTRTMEALGVIRDVYPVPEEPTQEATDSEAAELVESAAYEDEMPDEASFDAVVSLGEDGMKIELNELNDELEDE